MDLNNNFNFINKCRISGSDNLLPILDLGLQPLANSLKKTNIEAEDKFPLSISFCPQSSLVQLNETINNYHMCSFSTHGSSGCSRIV